MRRFIFFLMVGMLAMPGVLYALEGRITTVAGNGINIYAGDNGPAVQASLNVPRHVFVDGAGNSFISDWDNNRIRKVSPSGIITTVAGTGVPGFGGDNGLAVQAQLNGPSATYVDRDGNLYVCDTNNHRIRKIAANGVITTIAGTGVAGFSGDGGAASNARLHTPAGLFVGAQGIIYISDSNNQRIRKVDGNGIITTVAGNGVKGFAGDGGIATQASLNLPQGIYVDAGVIYIADRSNHRVRRVDTAGVMTTFAGNGASRFSGDFGPATQAALNVPVGVFLDGDKNLYIADRNNNRIRRVTSGGIITTVAGVDQSGVAGENAVAASAPLNLPNSVFVDFAGNLFVAEWGNNRVVQIEAVAGSSDAIVGVFGTDNEAPVLRSISVFNGSTGVAPKAINAAGLKFTANEPLDRTTVQTSVSAGSTVLSWRIVWAANSTRFTLLPNSGSALGFDQNYSVVISGVKDVRGNTSANLQINFTTKSQPIALPIISGIFPTQGPAGGGTLLTVTGDNFESGVLVLINGEPIRRIVSTTSNEVKVITPVGVPGVHDVTVLNVDGETAVLANAYTFVNVPPTILTVNPRSGSTAGGTEIFISGENFIQGVTVTVGGLPVTDIEVISDRLLSGLTPPSSTGSKTIVVVGVNNQRATLTGGFLYQTPPSDLLLPAKYKARIVVRVMQNGQIVPNVTLALFRSIAGRNRRVKWIGGSGTEGLITGDIREDPFGEFANRGASGMYRIVAVDEDLVPLGTWNSVPINGGYASEITLTVGGDALVTSETKQGAQTNASASLLPNFPNPFNPATQIAYELGQAGSVQLVIYNAIGQQVRILVDQHQALGRYRVIWDGKNTLGQALASGVYIYHLKTAQAVQTRRMLLLK